MAAIAALLDSRAALGALRRTVPVGDWSVRTCRPPAALERMVQTRLLDAIVLGPKAARRLSLEALRARYPRIPIVVYGPVRADDGARLLDWQSRLDIGIAVEGVDDPVVGERVVRQSVTARRRAALAHAPRLLRLTEPLQHRTWDLLVAAPGDPPATTVLARRLKVSREHLSRQFGAGGAPNLKRVMDLLQAVAALELLANPGYSVPAVAKLLGYSTPAHLRAVVRRVTGMRFGDFLEATVVAVVQRFAAAHGRSRRE